MNKKGVTKMMSKVSLMKKFNKNYLKYCDKIKLWIKIYWWKLKKNVMKKSVIKIFLKFKKCNKKIAMKKMWQNKQLTKIWKHFCDEKINDEKIWCKKTEKINSNKNDK